MTPRAVVLQHQRNAPPALLTDWARQRGVELEVMRADRDGQLPGPELFDFAITLGSDHSAGHHTPAWVERELEWLRVADRAEVPVLGICFGAQALAVALGGSIRRAQRPELGWISVQSDVPEIVGSGPWFAWHEDVCEPPASATEIAHDAFGAQAFLIGPHLGAQFHPEVTPEVAEIWSARSSGLRWLALVGLDLGRLADEGARHLGPSGVAGRRLFDALASRAASHSLRSTHVGDPN